MSSRAIDREALVHESLAGYQPAKIPNERWQQISEDVQQIVTDIAVNRLVTFSDYPTRRELRDVALHVAYFLDYCLDTFGDQYADRYIYFDNDTIALFSHFMLTKFSKVYVRVTVDCIRAVAVWRLKVDTAKETKRKRNPLQPYTDTEIRQLRHWLSGLRTEHRKINTSRVAALAMGAGFSSGEIFRTRRSHLCIENETVIVTSPNDGRSVQVQRDWDEPLRAFLKDASGNNDYLVIPKAKREGKVCRPLTEFLQLNAPPRYTVRRMRLTWQLATIQDGATEEEFGTLSGLGRYRTRSLFNQAREVESKPGLQSIDLNSGDSLPVKHERDESASTSGGGLHVVEERTA